MFGFLKQITSSDNYKRRLHSVFLTFLVCPLVCIEYPWQHYCAISFILGTPGRRLQVNVYVYVWVKVYLSHSATAKTT